ncbi:hypothetical protein L0663_01550 [Dyadobacter sp. CY107]|uniref:hypothetical protein n=1 Tax=Dyadobacter fanqingshengii TaxID=2906443 RepID=UPI001F290B25|nr:hypothetical protein [Dyadobacter fanqingshengii]MCF2502049.1 hypothetical protein [Dyadobacter fanqingshengii]
MEIGTIKSVHIYCHNGYYVTAALTLNVKGVNFCFGGHQVFLSGMYGGQADDFPYLGKFIFRCLQICDLEDWEHIKSQKVLVDIVDNAAVGIGTLCGSDFFYPVKEFKNGNRIESHYVLSSNIKS